MKVVALLSGLWLGACSVFGIRTAGEPPYTVRETVGRVEIRDYPARVAADTTVAGDEEAARSAGFRRLAGYIFGGNHGRRTIAMTAPVAQRGATIAMTAPVAQAPAEAAGWTIRFWMPAGSAVDSLPVPDDPDVRLVAVPAETYAVVRFSGLAGPATVRREQARLRDGLGGTQWVARGAPVTWFYDPPWTLPPLRRNEVAVAVGH